VKDAILAAVREAIAAEHARMIAAADDARAAATHEEARPENDKDTRAIEASYLARGQAMRVEELGEMVTRLRFLQLRTFGVEDPIDLTALVTLEVDGEEVPWRALLLPVAGGVTVEVDGVEIRVLTPAAPLGRALVGKRMGDDFELRIAGRVREYVVLDVA